MEEKIIDGITPEYKEKVKEFFRKIRYCFYKRRMG